MKIIWLMDHLGSWPKNDHCCIEIERSGLHLLLFILRIMKALKLCYLIIEIIIRALKLLSLLFSHWNYHEGFEIIIIVDCYLIIEIIMRALKLLALLFNNWNYRALNYCCTFQKASQQPLPHKYFCADIFPRFS